MLVKSLTLASVKVLIFLDVKFSFTIHACSPLHASTNDSRLVKLRGKAIFERASLRDPRARNFVELLLFRGLSFGLEIEKEGERVVDRRGVASDKPKTDEEDGKGAYSERER